MNVDVPIELDRVTIDTADGPTLITTSNLGTNHPVDIRVPTILSTLKKSSCFPVAPPGLILVSSALPR